MPHLDVWTHSQRSLSLSLSTPSDFVWSRSHCLKRRKSTWTLTSYSTPSQNRQLVHWFAKLKVEETNANSVNLYLKWDKTNAHSYVFITFGFEYGKRKEKHLTILLCALFPLSHLLPSTSCGWLSSLIPSLIFPTISTMKKYRWDVLVCVHHISFFCLKIPICETSTALYTHTPTLTHSVSFSLDLTSSSSPMH